MIEKVSFAAQVVEFYSTYEIFSWIFGAALSGIAIRKAIKSISRIDLSTLF